MLNSRYFKFIFCLILSLSSLHSSYAADQNINETFHSDQAFTVPLDEEIINSTGIQTQKLRATLYSPEIETFATRVNLSRLIGIIHFYLKVVYTFQLNRKTIRDKQTMRSMKDANISCAFLCLFSLSSLLLK